MTVPGRGPDVESYVRNETDAARIDRNYAELLQELRVAQAGVQIMFAFLLTIAFQPRFGELTSLQRVVYLTTLLSAACAVVLLVAPVAAHRVLFHKRLKDELVVFTGRLAIGGLGFLAIALIGAVGLVVDVVAGRTGMIITTAVMVLLVSVVWWLLPLRTILDGRNLRQLQHRGDDDS